MKANFPAHVIHSDSWQGSLPSVISQVSLSAPASSAAVCLLTSMLSVLSPPLACSHPVLCSSPCAHSCGTYMAPSCAFLQRHQLLLSAYLATPPGPPPQPICSFCWMQLLLPPQAPCCVCELTRARRQPSDSGAVSLVCFQSRGRWE